MRKGTCLYCGGPTVRPPGQRGPWPLYCSALCKGRAARERAVADGRYAEHEATRAARRVAERAAKLQPCPYCATTMDSPRRVQCGAPDCERRFNNDRQREWFRDYRERTGTHYAYQDRYKKQKLCETCGEPFWTREARIRFCSISCTNRSRHWDRACAWCGESFSSAAPTARWCSDVCRRDAEHAARSQIILYEGPPMRVLHAGRRIAAALALQSLRKRWYAGRCVWCGTWFVHDQPQTRTCSPRCAKRLAHRHRRAVQKAAFVAAVSPYKIFERDRWRCRLCGKAVRRDAIAPHPKAPVIDHIVPLAAGGTHEPANTQCAHFLCNSLKGARGGGEQLLLIG